MTIPHKISRMLWVPALSVVIGVPVLSWLLHASFASSLSSSYFFLTQVGQITGIIGAQLFAFTLVLSARIKVVEYIFGGLDKLYVIHHRTGVISFVLLAIHPIILAFRYLDDGLEGVMNFLVPVNNTLPRDFGIYAVIIMLLLLFVTFYGSIFSYRSLKNAHRFMGAAFFLGTLHIFLITSSMSDDIALKISCLGMAVVGCLAFVYRTLLRAYVVTRYDYNVSSVNDIGQGVVEVTLSPHKEIMEHLPGQFAMLSLSHSKVVSDEEHPFTISSKRDNGEIRFSVKALGDYTSLLSGVTVGTKATVEGPYGEFYYGYGSKTQVWVAGGIGVTPFVSMAEALLKEESIAYTIDFYYSVRSDKDGAYKDLFARLAKKHPSFTFHFMPSDTSGYITGEVLLKEIGDIKKRDIFVCGPPPMMAALTESLVSLGVSKRYIHSERFSLLK